MDKQLLMQMWSFGLAFGIIVGIPLGQVIRLGLTLSDRQRSIRVRDRYYVLEKTGLDHLKIWGDEHPEYYAYRDSPGRIWKICTDDSGSSVYDKRRMLKVVHNAGPRKAAKTLDDFLFAQFVEPALAQDELLNEYLAHCASLKLAQESFRKMKEDGQEETLPSPDDFQDPDYIDHLEEVLDRHERRLRELDRD